MAQRESFYLKKAILGNNFRGLNKFWHLLCSCAMCANFLTTKFATKQSTTLIFRQPNQTILRSRRSPWKLSQQHHCRQNCCQTSPTSLRTIRSRQVSTICSGFEELCQQSPKVRTLPRGPFRDRKQHSQYDSRCYRQCCLFIEDSFNSSLRMIRNLHIFEKNVSVIFIIFGTIFKYIWHKVLFCYLTNFFY